MLQFRIGVFETNSSSTHSVAIISAEDRKRWLDNDYVNFDNYFIGIKSREEIIDMLFDPDSEYGKRMRKVVNNDFKDEIELREENGKIILLRAPFEPSYPDEEEKSESEVFDDIFDTLNITNRDDIYGDDSFFSTAEEIYEDVKGPDGKDYLVVGYWTRG